MPDFQGKRQGSTGRDPRAANPISHLLRLSLITCIKPRAKHAGAGATAKHYRLFVFPPTAGIQTTRCETVS